MSALLLIATTTEALAQSRHVRKRERELAGKKEDRAADQAAAEKEGRERHLSIQSKQTRKEMKANAKRSRRYNDNKRNLFRKRK